MTYLDEIIRNVQIHRVTYKFTKKLMDPKALCFCNFLDLNFLDLFQSDIIYWIIELIFASSSLISEAEDFFQVDYADYK